MTTEDKELGGGRTTGSKRFPSGPRTLNGLFDQQESVNTREAENAKCDTRVEPVGFFF